MFSVVPLYDRLRLQTDYPAMSPVRLLSTPGFGLLGIDVLYSRVYVRFTPGFGRSGLVPPHVAFHPERTIAYSGTSPV